MAFPTHDLSSKTFQKCYISLTLAGFLVSLNNDLSVLAAGELNQLATQGLMGQILVNYVIVLSRAWNS